MKKMISIRKVDDLGRIVIPNKMRKDRNNLLPKNELEISYDSTTQTMTIRRVENSCFICNNKEILKNL